MMMIRSLIFWYGRVIDLSISTEITEFSGFINYGIPLPGGINELTENEILMPVFDTIKNETAVSVYDGSTVVVGGLISEGRSSVEDKVPFLGDLPGLGRLFRTQREIGVKRAILLFVSVDLLDSAARPLNQVAVD